MHLPFLKKQPRIPKQEPKEISTLEDLITPSSFKIAGNHLQINDKFARTLFVFTYPRFLQSNWLSPIINLDIEQDIAFFIHPSDTGAVLKNLQKSVARVQSQMSMQAESGKVRDPILETAYRDMEELRNRLQQGTEKFFKAGLYLTVYGESTQKLDKLVNQLAVLLESKLVYAKPALFQMQKGFKSTTPLGNDHLLIHTSMNSQPLSTFFPFISSDLTSNKGALYGINRHNNSLVLFDRFSLENANVVIFAKAGAGKSYFAKLDILRSMMLDTEVIVIDPENEYQHLAQTVDGSFIKISMVSQHHINPFDLPKPQQDESFQQVFRSNVISLIGLLRIMIGEKTEFGPKLTPEQDAILDRAITETYALYDIKADSDFSDKTPPTLSDLETVLQSMEGGADLAIRLEKYTKGTFAGFLNQQTNVSLDKQLTVFNIRDMEDELRPIAMYLIIHHIWNLVRSKLKKRILMIDEAWWMMQYQDAASFLFGIAKRARKYYLGVTTITQDIEDFVNSPYGKPIVTNSSLQLLLRQSPAAVDVLQKTFYLTDEEKFLLLESSIGEGLFFAGSKHIAIKVVASYAEDQVITSDPAQLLEIEKAKQELAEENNQE